MDRKEGTKREQKEKLFEQEIDTIVDRAEREAREYEMAIKKGQFDKKCPYLGIVEIYKNLRKKVYVRGWKDEAELYANQITLYHEKYQKDERLRELEGQKAEKQKEFEESLKPKIQKHFEMGLLKPAYDSKNKETYKIMTQALNLINEAEKLARSYEVILKKDILSFRSPYEEVIDMYTKARKVLQKIGWNEEAQKLNNTIGFYKSKKFKDDNLRAFELQKAEAPKVDEYEGKIGNKERILNLLKFNALTSKEIAKELNLSDKNTRTYLLRLKKEDKIKSVNKKGRFLIYTHQRPSISRNQNVEIGALEDDLHYLLNLMEMKLTPKDGVKFTPADLMNIRRIEERITDKIGGNLEVRHAIKDLIDFEQSFKEEINEKITKLEEKVDFITSRKVKSIKDEILEAKNEATDLNMDDYLTKPVSVKKLLKNQKIKKRNQTVEEYDYLLKSIVVGDVGVGKAALTNQFSKGFFTEDYKITIGVDYHVKTISIDTSEGPIKCKLQLWDTGGQERFSSIRPMYYRGSLGTILVFDLTNSASFEHLPQWIEEIRANIKTDIPVLLVGNKSDLIDQRAVSIEEISKFANDFNLYYMETSAKTGDGVGDCFYILACLMIGQGVPEQLIANSTVYAPGDVTKGGGQIFAPVTLISEPQPEYIAPPVPEPTLAMGLGFTSSTFQIAKPTVSHSHSLIDNMPQTIITKTEKKKIAKEKKKQDKEKFKIEKENKTSISLDDDSISNKRKKMTAKPMFSPNQDRIKCENCGYTIVRPYPNDQLCPKCDKFLVNIFEYGNLMDEGLKKPVPKLFKPKIVTASSKIQGVRKIVKKRAEDEEISLNQEFINLKGDNEYLKFCGITSADRTQLFASNKKWLYLLELTNNLDYIATSILGGDLDKMLLKSENNEEEKCHFFEENNIIYIVYGKFPDKKGKWVLEQMANHFSDIIKNRDVNNFSKFEKYEIENKFKNKLIFILKEYMQLQEVFSDQEIPYVEDWLRLDYVGLSSMSIGVISLLLDDEDRLHVTVPGEFEDLAEEIEMKESLLTAQIEAIAANTLGNTGAYPRWIAVKLGFQNYRFLTFKKYGNDYFQSCLTEGNLQKIKTLESRLNPLLTNNIDKPFTGNLRPFNKLKSQIKELIGSVKGRQYR